MLARSKTFAPIRLAWACAAATMVAGCNAPARSEPAAKATSAMPPASAPAKTAAVDEALAQRIREIAKGCQLTKTKSLQCLDNSQARFELTKEFLGGKRSRVAALPTLVALIANDDPVLSVVVSEVLATGFAETFGKDAKRGDVSSETTMGLIEAYHRFDEYRAHRIVPAATHAAILSGDAPKLHAAMGAKKDLQGIYRMVRRLMVHGRLSMLDKLEMAVEGDDPNLSMAAMESLRYMEDWTPQEQDAICPLVLRYFSEPPPGLAARAGQAAMHCRGAHLSALLAKMQTRLDEGKLADNDLIAIHGRCRDAKQVDPSECRNVVAFLETVAAGKKHDEKLRAAALNNLAAQLPTARNMPADFDAALVQRVARKLGKERNPTVLAAAKRVKQLPRL